MKLNPSEFISKAESLKSSEINARQHLESIRSQRLGIQSEIDTLEYRLDSLYMELESLQDDEDEETDNSAAIAVVQSEISSIQEEIRDYEAQDAELNIEESETEEELRQIELEEQETLADIQDSASRTNQNIALISSFGGDYANVSAQATGSLQQNMSKLSQAAQILGGNVAVGAVASGAGSKSATSGTSGVPSTGRNFYEAANNQRNNGNTHAGSFGSKGSNITGRNKREIYPHATSDTESSRSKSGGLGKRSSSRSLQTPQEALARYMSNHHYSREDFPTYSQDPEWRVLQRAAYPDYSMPPLNQNIAQKLLSQYMSSHNYSQADFHIYSKDPVWQELHNYAYPDFSYSHNRSVLSNSSHNYRSIIGSLRNSAVRHNAISLAKLPRSETQIINSLGGGDKTAGSCSSLAFAYAGNRAGYEVLDFRDGDSREFFSSNASIKMIAELPGVDSRVLYGKDDFQCANDLLNSMLSGKEYYLATGQHASIVRKVDNHFEYLELQSAWDNGWHRLDNSILSMRFGCDSSNQIEYPNFLIDIDSLSKSNEFLDVLGYINTAESDQMKGDDGDVR